MKIKLAIEFEMEKPENELDYIFISEIKNKINTVVESNIEGIKSTGEYQYLTSEYDVDRYELGVLMPTYD